MHYSSSEVQRLLLLLRSCAEGCFLLIDGDGARIVDGETAVASDD